VEGRVTAPSLAAAARLSPPSYRPGQHLRIHLALAVAPGWHVYGEPIDAAYTPLAITVDPLPGLEAGPVELPPPLLLASDRSGEALPAYEGALRGMLPVTLTKHIGDVTLTVRLRYQACDATLCHPPAELTIPLTLSGLDSIRD
jgi:DsbC/DsbD-like thiol-disulfide interchange protein